MSILIVSIRRNNHLHKLHFDALSDIDAFYREWLGRPLPDENRFEFKDLSLEVTEEWGK